MVDFHGYSLDLPECSITNKRKSKYSKNLPNLELGHENILAGTSTIDFDGIS